MAPYTRSMALPSWGCKKPRTTNRRGSVQQSDPDCKKSHDEHKGRLVRQISFRDEEELDWYKYCIANPAEFF